METRRWFNPSLPQTLQIANFLLYFNAFFGLLGLLQTGNAIYLVIVALNVAGGFGLANERKWGYATAVGAAVFPFALRLVFVGNPFSTGAVSLIFEIALLALVLHPQSREHQKIWFR